MSTALLSNDSFGQSETTSEEDGNIKAARQVIDTFTTGMISKVSQ
jgi:hypothetical protein